MTSIDHLVDFHARPNQRLDTHLSGVADAAAALTEDAGRTPYGEKWSTVMETMAWVHDIGKLTVYFQDYITSGDRSAAPSAELTYHGMFGGLVTVLALASRGCGPETTAAGFYAVAKHHSVLQNVQSDLGRYHLDKVAVDDRYAVAETQLENIDTTAQTAADAVLVRATDGALRWDDIGNEGLARARQSIRGFSSGVIDEQFYGCVLRAWSTLVTADKFDASGLTGSDDVSTLTRTPRPSPRDLTEEVRDLSETRLPDGEQAAVYLDDPTRDLLTTDATVEQRLAAVRTAANARATANLRSGHADGTRVFELTLPTGFGKTYSGLRAALTLAQERDSRVIYALPYTSIIDQVDRNIRDVFGVDPHDPAYTKHHHLADTRTIPNGDDAFVDHATSGEETLHAEAWRSGLILTTFTQLFESAAGPRNVQSTKLPALQDSVILLDEPQAISLDWWEFIGRSTEYLTAEYDTSVLFMTATQPKILEQLPDVSSPAPLVDLQTECAEIIRDAPRVEFHLHKSLASHIESATASPLSLTAAAAEIDRKPADGSNTLAIVNTVGSAVTFSESLSSDGRVDLAAELLTSHRETDTNEFDPNAYLQRLAATNPDAERLVATLTTRLRPVDQNALLGALDRILDTDVTTPFDEVPTVTVSTQLVEAGVDLSFDRLYRDYAPLPAIVQAAGRCNRRFDGPPAPVTVWRLDSPPDKDYVPSDLIYGGRSLLRPTRSALSELRTNADVTTLAETSMISDGIESYYDALHCQRRTEEREDDLVTAFDTAQGKKLRNATLISEEYPTRDVLVLVSKADVRYYETYCHHRENGAWTAAQECFQDLKRALVSVPVKEEPPDDEPLVVRTPAEPKTYELTSGRGVVGIESRDDAEI